MGLNGQVESSSGVPVRLVRWTQIEGPPVTILNPLEPQTAILTPDVTSPTKLVFRLYGVNVNDFANSDTATVMVQPLASAAKVVSVATTETENAIQFLIRLQRPTAEPFVLAYRTLDGTAKSGEDYEGVEYRLLAFQRNEIEKYRDPAAPGRGA